MADQGDVALLQDPLAQALLTSREPARLACRVQGVAPEYEACARRYFGDEQGAAWVQTLSKLGDSMMRIEVKPEWVGLLDFEQRFPSALARQMAAATS
jgi:hypothetical protein